jgi:hypothetical protein
LVPPTVVTRDNTIVKSSSNSTRLSEFAVTDAHISAPSAEPGAKVKGMESEEKSPSSLVAAM